MHDLLDEELARDSAKDVAALRERRITGPTFFARVCDGVLSDEDLSQEGDEFAAHYFDFKTGKYLADYHELLSSHVASEFHVADTWESYDRIASRVDQRYEEFLANHRREPNG